MMASQIAVGSSCVLTSGDTVQVNYSIPKTISVPLGTANGTLLYTVQSSASGKNSFSCAANGSYYNVGVDGEQGKVANDGILPFGSSGLGYKLYSQFGPKEGEGIYPISTRNYHQVFDGPYTLKIYKIGELKSSIVPAGVFARYRVAQHVSYVANLTSDIEVEQGSCEVPGITVPMGEYTVSDFEAPGLTVGTREFFIKLQNCSAGISKVTYMMDGVDGNYLPGSGVIKLGAKSVAGVGVQIKHNGLPVSLGKWLNDLEAPKKGNNSYTFSAAYYQIDKKVTAGQANASLRVTMKYL